MLPPQSVIDPVRSYRAYHLDDTGKIRTFSVIEAENDHDAIAKARLLAVENAIELWQNARLIERLPGSSPRAKQATPSN